MNIRSISMYGVQNAFIPCGVCKECRDTQKAAWSFRLRCELEELVKRGWWLGFCTLTYNDYSMPHFPRVLLNDWAEYDITPMCFDKSIPRQWLIDLRQWLIRTYDCVKRKNELGEIVKDDAIRYLLCCEYGEHTKRCHHHFLMALPSVCPPQEVFKNIHESWKYGFVFPKDFYGGLDGHGYQHKPFVVDCVSAAAAYAAKYVCKDLAFFESFNRRDFKSWVTIPAVEGFVDEKTVKLSDYLPFHMQSKSLGRAFVESLDDAKKLELLRNGCGFVGSPKLQHLPTYMRNKLLYTNYYFYNKDGVRTIRRKPTDFFRRNYSLIFEDKVKFYHEQINKFFDSGNLRFACQDDSKDYQKTKSKIASYNLDYLAKFYAAFGGVSASCCYDVPFSDFWFSRYQVEEDSTAIYEVEFPKERNFLNFPTLVELHENLNKFMNLSFRCQKNRLVLTDKMSLDDERKINKVRDFFKG